MSAYRFAEAAELLRASGFRDEAEFLPVDGIVRAAYIRAALRRAWRTHLPAMACRPAARAMAEAWSTLPADDDRIAPDTLQADLARLRRAGCRPLKERALADYLDDCPAQPERFR